MKIPHILIRALIQLIQNIFLFIEKLKEIKKETHIKLNSLKKPFKYNPKILK